MVFDNTPEPLAAFPYIITNNPEEWQHAIKLLLSCSKLDIKPSKNFSAFVNATKLGNINVLAMGSLVKFSHIYTHESEDTLLNLLLSGNVTVKVAGYDFFYKPFDFNVSHRSDAPKFISQENIQTIHYMFKSNILLNFFNTVYGREQTALDVKNIIDSRVHNSYFQQVLCETVKSIGAFPDIVNLPIVASQYEQLLMLSLLIPPTRNRIASKAPPTSANSVKLVEEYIEANIDEPIRLEDLAVVTGQSVRTIQEAFKKYRGCSPSSFLRECRLAKARKILQESPKDTSIVSVAVACGFASHGHFSYCYKKQFGENPLNTLKKTNL
jgi:AraC-like DNA-binding protein